MFELKRALSFIGPGFLVAIGYLDPGNWATDLAAGSEFGYSLLYIILLSNIMAIILQYLCLKLGVISQLDLAQACRKSYPFSINIALYILCEIAIIACDIAEVIGSAIALSLLFGIPVQWGVVLTSLDVFLILLGYSDKKMRLFEGLIMILFFAIGACFSALLFQTHPDWYQVLIGFIPSTQVFTNEKALYIAMGIVGSTVMPHNLYLHSNIVKNRSNRSIQQWGQIKVNTSSQQAPPSLSEDEVSRSLTSSTDSAFLETQQDESRHSLNTTEINNFWNSDTMKHMIELTSFDSTIALSFALFINSAILIVSAAAFYDGDGSSVSDLTEAYRLLVENIGPFAGYAFAIALLFAGQSSTITGTLAGQICMEGFLGPTMKISPALRRLLTRSLAIIPAVLIASYKGERGINDLLIFSQVILSLQLPFAIWPLISFTSNKKLMSIKYIQSSATILDFSPDIPDSETSFLIQDSPIHDLESSHTTIDYSNSLALNILAYSVGIVITAFNFILVLEFIF